MFINWNRDLIEIEKNDCMNKEFGSIIIYKTQDGNNKIEVKVYKNNVWLNQKQLSEFFCVSKATISEHIKNIFNDEELISKSVVRNFRTTAADGKNYNVDFYNLDIFLLNNYVDMFGFLNSVSGTDSDYTVESVVTLHRRDK